VIKVDNSQKPSPDRGAVYKGASIGEIHGQRFIFAANFRSRRIDVFDSAFNQVHVPHWAFHDDDIPRGFAPFNIQGIGPNLYDAGDRRPLGAGLRERRRVRPGKHVVLHCGTER